MTRKTKSAPAPEEAASPPSSRERILDAAVHEFAHRGLFGARVDVIAAEAKINKQLIYYHFGSKEALYVRALEKSYRDLREQERRLNLDGLDPIAAMRRFVEFTFDYVTAHREFVLLLMNENLQEARYLKQSDELKDMRSPLAGLLEGILERGVAAGIFSPGIEPLKLYTTIASLCFFYASNIFTLSVFLDTDLRSRRELAAHRRHIIAVVLGYLRHPAEPTDTAPARAKPRRRRADVRD